MIANDVLFMSKLEVGKVKLHITPFIPSELIDSVLTMCSLNIHLHKITLVKNYSMMTSSVYGDPSHLSQVLLNLIQNSIKFTSMRTVRCVTVVCEGRMMEEDEEGKGKGKGKGEEKMDDGKKKKILLLFTIEDTGM